MVGSAKFLPPNFQKSKFYPPPSTYIVIVILLSLLLPLYIYIYIYIYIYVSAQLYIIPRPRMMRCDVSLEWLYGGDGHDFYDDASAKVSNMVKECLKVELARGADARLPEAAD